MAKKKSKLKKILGGVAAAATAAALMRGKDKGALTADRTRDMVPMDERMVQGLNVKPSDNVTAGINKMAKINQFGKSGTQGGDENMDYLYRAKGGRVGHKKGGRVGVGIAKRGFGRAMKGRK